MLTAQIRETQRELNAERKETTLEIEGRRVHVTNLGKVFWPEHGWTKGDMISYYVAVSPYLLPHLRNRPLVMVRYPDGIGGESWFHKDVPGGAPDWVETIAVEHHEAKAHTVNYVICNDLATLVWLAQMATIEIHTWSAATQDVRKADVAVFDVDPQTDRFEDAVWGAEMICGLMDELKLKCYVKTTGKRGIHVFAPLKPMVEHSEVRDFAHEVVMLLDRRHPGEFALSYSKAKRVGRVFVDYAQNSFGKTNIAPYSLRATKRATVSTPIRRSYLRRTRPTDYRLDTVPRRLARAGDLWRGLHEDAMDTVAEARQRLAALAVQQGASNRK
jgi:bifunctional non-homologous end joining protein LigD